MKKRDRELIFNKYEGKCAYCGEALQKGWHVDELLPVKRGYTERYCMERHQHVRELSTIKHPERFHIDNQMPACASCNINKHDMSLEQFRDLIAGFMKHLNGISTQYKIAKRYGLVIENIKPVTFYFENHSPAIGSEKIKP